MEIGDTVVGVGTEDISVADWLAELSQKPKPTAASPAATTTPISVRIFETLLHRAGNELLTFCVEEKGNTPDPSQLLRGQDPAQYLIIILIETIKNLYVSAQPHSRSTQSFRRSGRTAKEFLASRPVLNGAGIRDWVPQLPALGV